MPRKILHSCSRISILTDCSSQNASLFHTFFTAQTKLQSSCCAVCFAHIFSLAAFCRKKTREHFHLSKTRERVPDLSLPRVEPPTGCRSCDLSARPVETSLSALHCLLQAATLLRQLHLAVQGIPKNLSRLQPLLVVHSFSDALSSQRLEPPVLVRKREKHTHTHIQLRFL